KPRQPLMRPRSGVHASMESSSASTPHEASMGTPPPIVSQTPPASLFFRGGSSSQLHINTTDDIRWKPRTQMHSSVEERDEDQDEGGGEDEEEEDEEPEPQLRQNPPRN
ncbi:hypothetical protein J1N35_028035, partial [Gossypium stocksii]